MTILIPNLFLKTIAKIPPFYGPFGFKKKNTFSLLFFNRNLPETRHTAK